MKIIDAGYELIDTMNGDVVLSKLERIGRTCYKSEGKIKDGSAKDFVGRIIKSGHEAIIEHYSFSVKFTVDRGITHEIVRHRLASYAGESTRYVNYAKQGGITVIKPCYLVENSDAYKVWAAACQDAEDYYFNLIDKGLTPERARVVLPTSLKAELVVTTNLREWRTIFKLRCSPKAHPQIREVMIPLLKEMKKRIPVVFDDIEV